MTEQSLRQKMRKEWQDVRKRFHYPQLPQPELVDDVSSGMIDIKSLEIKVSEPFIKGFEKHGIEHEESLNEVLTHELTHFMKFPGSVLNVLRLQKSAQGLADGNKVTGLRTAFTEAQTNLYMTQEVKHPATAKMRKAHGLEEGDAFGRLMYGLYQEVSEQDFGVELNEEERGLVGKLGEINFLDKVRETNNFRTFVQILKDYQPPQQNKQGQGQDGQGDGEGQQDQGEPCAGSGNGLEGFTDNQIREGLKQFSQECSNPGEYEKIVRQILDEKSGEELGSQQKPSGKRAGSGRGITELAGNFYTALAEKYTIPITSKLGSSPTFSKIS